LRGIELYSPEDDYRFLGPSLYDILSEVCAFRAGSGLHPYVVLRPLGRIG